MPVATLLSWLVLPVTSDTRPVVEISTPATFYQSAALRGFVVPPSSLAVDPLNRTDSSNTILNGWLAYFVYLGRRQLAQRRILDLPEFLSGVQKDFCMTKKSLWIAVAILALVGLLAWRWSGRTPSEADGAQNSEAAVRRPRRQLFAWNAAQLGNTLTIAGEFKPFQDVEVHAKVAGYIRKINVDVGDHVKEAQVLAVLEVPELAAELSGADAAVRRSEEEIRRAAERRRARAVVARGNAFGLYPFEAGVRFSRRAGGATGD